MNWWKETKRTKDLPGKYKWSWSPFLWWRRWMLSRVLNTWVKSMGAGGKKK